MRRRALAAIGLWFALLTALGPFLPWSWATYAATSGLTFAPNHPRRILVFAVGTACIWAIDVLASGVMRRMLAFAAPLVSVAAAVLVVREVINWTALMFRGRAVGPGPGLWLTVAGAGGLAVVGVLGLFIRPAREPSPTTAAATQRVAR